MLETAYWSLLLLQPTTSLERMCGTNSMEPLTGSSEPFSCLLPYRTAPLLLTSLHPRPRFPALRLALLLTITTKSPFSSSPSLSCCTFGHSPPHTPYEMTSSDASWAGDCVSVGCFCKLEQEAW